MRKLLSLAALFLFFGSHMAQAQGSRVANIKFGKVDRPGLIAQYAFSEGIVETALKGRLERAGLGKPKSDKGFMSYQGKKWEEISPSYIDVYAKVDGKDNQSTIVLLVSKGYDNYITDTSDPVLFGKLKAFMDGLVPDIMATQLAAEIAAQEDVVKKAEREYKDADEEGNKLSRERERLERQIGDNNSTKKGRGEALSAAKAKLEQMRSGK